MVPERLLDTFTPAEAAFQCEDELIAVIPHQTVKAIALGGWTLPAMRPLQESRIPLWVALLLKKQGRCKIKFPSWLEQEELRKFIEAERNAQEFSRLPWSWQVMSRVLLEQAPDDLDGDIDTVREQLKDLTELRQAKIRAGVTQTLNESQISMDGMGVLELNEVRPVLTRAMSALGELN